MIEFPDPGERDAMLRQLTNIENRVWLQIGDGDKIRPIADEDIERTDDENTSAVHFVRFELHRSQVEALKEGAELAAGIDHDSYQVEICPVAENIRRSLLSDLD